jgi:adenosylcobinamide kinase/adenosylcobinamide-phosphate guanylyltransferase
VGKLANIILITGGAGCGKSEFAESLAKSCNEPIFFVATMSHTAGDPEQLERILEHQGRRPKHWLTFEILVDLENLVNALPQGPGTCLIDCLSLYVSNMLLTQSEQKAWTGEIELAVKNKIDLLVQGMEKRPDINFIVVTNEVGMGIVPDNRLARRYRYLLASANRQMASAADQVWLLIVGLPVKVK